MDIDRFHKIDLSECAQEIGTIVLLEKAPAGRFCLAGDPGSNSKIPKKKKADIEAPP